MNLDSIWVDYIAGGGKWGVNAPIEAEFTFSTDGVNFTDAQTFDEFNDDAAWSGGWDWFSERRLTAEVGGVTATHVKMRLEQNFWTFLSEVQFLEVTGESGGLEGDLNGDGFVGSADLDIVRGAWGQSVSGAAAGDPSGDGVVGSADLDIIRANWGATSSASAVVPEPASILMILLGTIGVFAMRKRG